MAKIDQGILGGFSGKVGTVVGCRLRGQWVVRAYRAHIADPRTLAQLEQRSRFALIIRSAQALLPAIRLGFGSLARRRRITEGNCFTSVNTAAFTVAAGEVRMDASALQLSSGRVALPRFDAPMVDAEGRVEVRYSSAAGPRAAGTDTVCLVAYIPAQQVAVMASDARRSHGVAALALPRHWLGEEVHLYAFVVNKQGEASPTAYLGTLREAQAQHMARLTRQPVQAVGPEEVARQAAGLYAEGAEADASTARAGSMSARGARAPSRGVQGGGIIFGYT